MTTTSAQTDATTTFVVGQLRHPSERSRYWLALATCLTVVAILIASALPTMGVSLAAVLAFAAMIWFAHSLLRAQLLGNAVMVSFESFPEVRAIIERVCTQLQYKKRIEAFVLPEGEVNAVLYALFRSRLILLNSGLVESMLDDGDQSQLVWIVGRFVGALKARQTHVRVMAWLLSSFENLVLFNLFLLPYVRASQYTGDNIGLVLCGDPDAAISAYNKLMLGKELHQRLGAHGFISQRLVLQNKVLAWVARLGSAFPYNADRYLNLLAFSRAYDPDGFEAYMGRKAVANEQSLRGIIGRYDALPKAIKEGVVQRSRGSSAALPESGKRQVASSGAFWGGAGAVVLLGLLIAGVAALGWRVYCRENGIFQLRPFESASGNCYQEGLGTRVTAGPRGMSVQIASSLRSEATNHYSAEFKFGSADADQSSFGLVFNAPQNADGGWRILLSKDGNYEFDGWDGGKWRSIQTNRLEDVGSDPTAPRTIDVELAPGRCAISLNHTSIVDQSTDVVWESFVGYYVGPNSVVHLSRVQLKQQIN